MKMSRILVVGSSVACTETARHLNLSGINLKFVGSGAELVEAHDIENDFLLKPEDKGKGKLETLKSALEAMNPHNSV
jgi:hypothetical protein